MPLLKIRGIKIAILIGASMFACPGMMYQGTKYIIANIPILSYLNPVNLLTDAFYCLYYYDTFTRYALNIVLLCVFIIVFCLGTFIIRGENMQVFKLCTKIIKNMAVMLMLLNLPGSFTYNIFLRKQRTAK